MNTLLGFAPFIVFSVLNRFMDSFAGLLAATLVPLLLLGREWRAGRVPKMLEIGSTVLFGGLALYAFLSRPNSAP